MQDKLETTMTTFKNQDINEQINALITEIYHAFSQYSIQEIHGVCTYCCMNKESANAIEKSSLKSLTSSTIREYLDAAQYDTHNDTLVSEIKYLLPRAFELFNDNQEIRLENELNFDKFYFNLTTLWKPSEIELIEQFVKLHFHKTVIERDENICKPLDELILMWLNSGLDIEFLFEQWEIYASHSKAIVDYVSLLYSIGYNPCKETFSSKNSAKGLIDWATSARVIKHFQDSIYANLDNLDTLSEAELFDYDYLLNYT